MSAKASPSSTGTTATKKHTYAEYSTIAAVLAASSFATTNRDLPAVVSSGVKALDKVLMPIGHALTLLGQGVEPAVMFIPLDKTEPMQMYDRTLRTQLGEFDRLAFGTFGFKVRAITNAVVHGHPVVLVLREPQKHGADDFTISAYKCSNWTKEIHSVKITMEHASWEQKSQLYCRDTRDSCFSIAMNGGVQGDDQILVAHDAEVAAFDLQTGKRRWRCSLLHPQSYHGSTHYCNTPATVRNMLCSLVFHEGTNQILLGWENATVQILRSKPQSLSAPSSSSNRDGNKQEELVVGDIALPLLYDAAHWEDTMSYDKDFYYYLLHTSIATHPSDPSHGETFFAACGMRVWRIDAVKRTILSDFTTPFVSPQVPSAMKLRREDLFCQSIAWLSRDMLVQSVCEVGETMHKSGTEGGDAQVLKVWDHGSLPPGSAVQLPRLQPWSSEGAAKAKSDLRVQRASSSSSSSGGQVQEQALLVAEATLPSGYSLKMPSNVICLVLPKPERL